VACPEVVLCWHLAVLGPSELVWPSPRTFILEWAGGSEKVVFLGVVSFWALAASAPRPGDVQSRIGLESSQAGRVLDKASSACPLVMLSPVRGELIGWGLPHESWDALPSTSLPGQ
jgi:hypothetical protein